MTIFTIQQLTKNDWPIYKKIRLEALKNSPESFASSYEEEITWSDIDFQNSLIKSDIFGAFDNNSLVSCAGFYIGFKIYGTEPSALKIKNVYFDEYLTVLSLTTITHKI